MNRLFIPFFIGVITSLAGFPVVKNGELSGKNLVLLFLCIITAEIIQRNRAK